MIQAALEVLNITTARAVGLLPAQDLIHKLVDGARPVGGLKMREIKIHRIAKGSVKRCKLLGTFQIFRAFAQAEAMPSSP